MAVGYSAISRANAEHYTWGQGCDGWYLVKDDQLTVIQERMPPGTAETFHKHTRAHQFFFVLAGLAVMEHGGVASTLTAGTGLEVPPGVPHRILNNSDSDLEFLVTSVPPSHVDRVAVDPSIVKPASVRE